MPRGIPAEDPLMQPWRQRTEKAVLAAKERRTRGSIEELYAPWPSAAGGWCGELSRRPKVCAI